MDVSIRSMCDADIDAVVELANVHIGDGYYTEESVTKLLNRSRINERTISHVACHHDKVIGFRFALPPGRWTSGRGRGLSPHRWSHPLSEAAYFQSSFVNSNYTGQGIGKKLAQRALSDLREIGARLVVTHSWKESPHNSSFRYLSRIGFEAIVEYPRYWSEIDYVCSLDGKPCQCTAIEMVLNLDQWWIEGKENQKDSLPSR